MESLHWLVTQRQNGLLPHNVFARGTRDSSYLVKRLANTRVLEGHHGCVNSVSWNDSGSRLVSGSDDCHLNIYDITTGLIRHSFHTTHQSNIFSAKFLPYTGDYKMVSCAGIGSVEVSEVTPYGEYVGHQFKCQTSITYQVATTPGCPHEFLTCEEKGMVRMYDIRTCSSCHCDSDCNRSILCRFPSAVTSMAVHPLEPHYIAVGLGDGTIRLLDRRRADYWQADSSTAGGDPLLLGASCALVKYRPASLKDKKLKITSVNFNHDGTQILASYSEDYVYLFNSGLHGCGADITLTPRQITRPQYPSQYERYPGRRQRTNTKSKGENFVSKNGLGNDDSTANGGSLKSSSSTDEKDHDGRGRGHARVPPAAKRIRLRGDWSDTGPEARPENLQSEQIQGGNLMNRMSRMFARWVEMSLDNISSEEDGEVEESVSGEDGEVGNVGRWEVVEGRGRGDPSLGNEGDEAVSDMSHHISSDSDDRLDSPSSIPSENEPQLQGSSVIIDVNAIHTVQEVTERAMYSAVTEAVDRAMIESTSIDTQDTNICALDETMERNRGTNTIPRTVETVTNDTDDIHADTEHSGNNSNSFKMEGEAREKFDSVKGDRDSKGTLTPDVMDHSCTSTVYDETVNRSRDEEAIITDRDTVASILPSTSGHRSCDQSYDRSHDHSYRRSRFKIQRRRDGNTKGEGEGEVKEGATGNDENSEGTLEGDSEMNRRLMREASRSVNTYLQPFMVYKGHRNSRTMIKQANFFGDNWVMSGSDCGRVFVWDKWSGEVVNMFTADSHVVNCVQPHPSAHMIATSGIDYNVKLWEPVAAHEASLDNLKEVMRRNEQMLQESRSTITIPSSFLLRILAYLNRSGRMRNSQDQQQPPHNDSD